MRSEGLLGSGRCSESSQWNTSLEPCKVSAGHGAVSTAVFPECLQRYQVLCASYFTFVITLEIGDSFTDGELSPDANPSSITQEQHFSGK